MMGVKEEIELLLRDLKRFGKDRRTIEQDLNYSPNYIDQLLSKGGNERFYSALKRYRDMLTQTIQEERYNLDDLQVPGKWQLQEGAGFWTLIPEYKDCDYTAKSRSKGMEPLIQHGALVGGKQLSDPSVIVYGEIYIIQATNGMEVIRYVQPDPDDPEGVLLVALRDHVPPTRLRRSDIQRIYEARFVVNPL
jgi:hypothetical protein